MMNKIKDLIYDFNDIFVALLIVIITTGVVVWRVGVIMDYPSFISGKGEDVPKVETDFSGIDLTPVEVDPNLNTNPNEENAGGIVDPGTQETPSGSTEQTPPEENTTGSAVTEEPTANGGLDSSGTYRTAKEVTFEIKKGEYGAAIGENLAKQGLVASKDAFVNALVNSKRDKYVKIGTFTIPAGSSVDDIVSIITK